MEARPGCSNWSEREEDADAEEEEEEEEGNTSNSSLTAADPVTTPSQYFVPLLCRSGSSTTPLSGVNWPFKPVEPAGQTDSSTSLEDSGSRGSWWHLIPDVVMVKILSCLDDVDRCSACMVCAAWRRNFRTPCLWRRRAFVFRDYEAIEKQESYSKYLMQLGPYLHHASIELSHPNVCTVNIIARAFERFVWQLNKCSGMHLLSIRVVSMDFLSGWHFFSHNRGKVVRALCNLLKKQSTLRSADLSYSLMDRDEGTRVLDALSYGTRLHPKLYLTHLDMRRIFYPETGVISLARYTKVMGQFVALSSVTMDLRSLNEAVLQRLTQACAKSLRRMELDFYADESVVNQAIGTNCWRTVAESCISLAVTVRIHGLCSFEKYASVLVKGIPLDELCLTYLGVEALSDNVLLQGVENLFTHLAETYCQTLIRLYVKMRPHLELSADSAVINLVKRCEHLNDLSINFAVQGAAFLRILEEVHKRKATPKTGAKTTRLHLNVRGMTPDLEQSVRKLTSVISSDGNGKWCLLHQTKVKPYQTNTWQLCNS